MSTRTQVYLTDEQRRRIDELASAEGVTMAEIIRRAVDGYLDEQADPSAALSATFGSAPDLKVPSRDEWDRGQLSH
jgi:predicted DNA-binding protein